ncbi:DUF4919 domain-containing protein [Sphingomonas sp. LB-2]|uniref:DUF4919 domain-containing protein n=1 Tax=Sphingomonas caeni TaxID=2984949 RepID=UPI00222E6F3A|nr:DUF4919 domain-containing protein [Sphingomonas caeni]MCW3849307.1 DUF4919 domain-containing protein [Sphingomonas caeni]
MILAAIALMLLTPVTAPAQQNSSGRVAKILKTGDGKSAETAYVVKSVAEEYMVIRELGLQPEMQSLIMKDNKPYDLMTVVDPKTGNKVEIWFDISSFFGKDF